MYYKIHNSFIKVCALLAATLILPALAYADHVNVSPACWAKVLYCRFCIVSIGVAGGKSLGINRASNGLFLMV